MLRTTPNGMQVSKLATPVKTAPNREKVTRSTYANGRVQLVADNVAILCRATLDSLVAGKVAVIELDNGESSIPYVRGIRAAAKNKQVSVKVRKIDQNIVVRFA